MPTIKPNSTRLILKWQNSHDWSEQEYSNSSEQGTGFASIKPDDVSSLWTGSEQTDQVSSTTAHTQLSIDTSSIKPIRLTSTNTIDNNEGFSFTQAPPLLSTTIQSEPITINLGAKIVDSAVFNDSYSSKATTVSSFNQLSMTSATNLTSTTNPMRKPDSLIDMLTTNVTSTSFDFATTQPAVKVVTKSNPYNQTTTLKIQVNSAKTQPSSEPKRVPASTLSNTHRKPANSTRTPPSSPKQPTNSTQRNKLAQTSRKPSSQRYENTDEWVNQIHQITTPKPYDAHRDCGVRSMKREGRVVGGRDSHLGEFPWSVLIRETTLLGFFVKTKCGGVLIDLKWVLTAAHCQPGMFGSLVVVVGEYDLGGKSSRLKPMIKKVKRMIIHRDYNPSNFDNDIALLELESPYQVQPHVVPICLPGKGKFSSAHL